MTDSTPIEADDKGSYSPVCLYQTHRSSRCPHFSNLECSCAFATAASATNQPDAESTDDAENSLSDVDASARRIGVQVAYKLPRLDHLTTSGLANRDMTLWTEPRHSARNKNEASWKVPEISGWGHCDGVLAPKEASPHSWHAFEWSFRRNQAWGHHHLTCWRYKCIVVEIWLDWRNHIIQNEKL